MINGDVLSRFGRLGKEKDILNGETLGGTSHFALAVEGQIAVAKKRRRFIQKNNYQPGLEVFDKYTGVRGKIQKITSEGEIVISEDGDRTIIKMNPLNTEVLESC